MKKFTLVCCAACMLLMSVVTLQAAVRDWQADTVHSNFYFSVDHIFSRVQGHFDEFTIEMQFDPANLAGSSMIFTVSTKSINTSNAKRDKHLQSADFFDAAKFPEMVFRSTSISQTGEMTYDVAGTFTVKGVDYDLVVPLMLSGVKDHPMEKNKEVAGFNGKLTIDRLAYKIGTGKFVDYGVVGKDVAILISLEVLSGK